MQIPGETVEVPEIPWQSSVELPAQSSAVIVVDMQNDFVKEGGALVVPDAAATLDSLQTLLERARRAGVCALPTRRTATYLATPNGKSGRAIVKQIVGAGRSLKSWHRSRKIWSARRAAMTGSTAPGWSTF